MIYLKVVVVECHQLLDKLCEDGSGMLRDSTNNQADFLQQVADALLEVMIDKNVSQQKPRVFRTGTAI